MKNAIVNILDKPLLLSQKVLQKVRAKLADLRTKPTLPGTGEYISNRDNSKPNDSQGWEEIYVSDNSDTVKEIEDELAFKMLAFTGEGDTLLETGCGLGKVSAQLALGNREVHLSDFSEKILNQAIDIFKRSGISLGGSYVFDMTKQFPLADDAIDTIWSSGVLEHWTEEEVLPIMKEMVRVSRKSVISFVPYSGCVFYRMSKYLMEKNGSWPYGRELPRASQKDVFEAAGLTNISETIMLNSWAPNLLWAVIPEKYADTRDWWNSLPEDDIVKKNQGYLLATIGYKK